MKDRIRQLMESQHMTQQNFSEYLGISSASLSSLFTGRTQPTLNHVNAIKKRFPTINLDWLMFGHGPMFMDGQPDENQPSDSPEQRPGEPLLIFGDDSPTPSLSAPATASRLGVQPTLNKNEKVEVKYIDKPQRKITEIRIFYDDQTWETFVPKK